MRFFIKSIIIKLQDIAFHAPRKTYYKIKIAALEKNADATEAQPIDNTNETEEITDDIAGCESSIAISALAVTYILATAAIIKKKH